MNLETQIQSLVVSFVYGMFSSLLYNIFYFCLYMNNKIIRVIINILFSITIFSLFFFLMLIINKASYHPYFILLYLTGFLIGNKKLKVIRIYPKKKERI